jgi:hypothetical protein
VAPSRKIAIAAGVFYLVTHVTSIAALILYGPVLNSPDYVVGTGADTPVLLGALLEVPLALAIVGTAVTLFPVVKRENEGMALGYVGLRTLASLLYRSRLVPRFIAVLGLVGGPLIFASATAVLFGLYKQVSVWGSLTAIPVFAWELTLAFWLIAKGFRPSASSMNPAID